LPSSGVPTWPYLIIDVSIGGWLYEDSLRTWMTGTTFPEIDAKKIHIYIDNILIYGSALVQSIMELSSEEPRSDIFFILPATG
jgi:hypothetical protein